MYSCYHFLNLEVIMRRFVVTGVIAIVSWSGAVEAQELGAPRKMRLEDCVTEALRANPDVRLAVDEHDAATAGRWEAGGNFGPRVHLDASVQQWNSPFAINFGAQAFQVRDAFTWSFTASAIQPLTGLFVIYEQYRVKDYGVDVAAIKRDTMRRDVGYRVGEGYYRLLQAERLAEVAVSSTDQLTLQLKQADSFHDQGVVSRDDVLRAELALANAKQRVIQSRAQVSLARSRLAVLMGMSPSAAIDAVPLDGEPDLRTDITLERAESKALSDRVELKQVAAQLDQAKSGVRLAWYKMAPQVNLIASYQHQEGSQFAQVDAAFVGGSLSWDIWDWGSSIAGVRAANAGMRQANDLRTKLEDQLRLEVREAFLNVGTATEGMQVARAAVSAAEEHYRLVNKRYEANTTTSFDVVDAENLLTQARAQLQTSTYDLLVARGALRRATGDPPTAQH